MSFADLSERAQVARLRVTALEALRAYPFEVARLKLLNHGFNTTFGVRTERGERFALRLNVNSRRSVAQIGAEMAWLAALSRDTDLNLPVPQATRDGALMGHVYSPDLERALPFALFSWLPGDNLGDKATPMQMREVGRATATLHAHARGFTLPVGTMLYSARPVLMDSRDNFQDEHELLTSERREVIGAAFQRAQAALDAVYARDREIPLHADLHNWNLKWARGKLYVFDFDDSIMGVPMHDLAISAYYLRDHTALEDALLEGYAAHATLPMYSSAEFEALVVARNLVLVNDLFSNSNAGLRAYLPRYLANSVTKLRYYLETGVFKHEVPGLIPASES
jgi:Ser/Thr protein kinase RdoA (MazF antagonist)